MIGKAFSAYTAAVEAEFNAARDHTRTRTGLLDEVNNLEESEEFQTLLEETRSTFGGDWHSSRSGTSWRQAIQNFFRRSGYYSSAFAGSETPGDLAQRFEAAFQRRLVQTTYLAPMEFVRFPKSELKFPGFEIRQFDRSELDMILANNVNRIFYPYAHCRYSCIAVVLVHRRYGAREGATHRVD